MSGCAGSRPDDIVREQRVVCEASQLLRVSEGRYSACRIPGRVPNLVGAGSPHTTACGYRESVFVQSIRTADESHNRFFVNDEDERLDDLCDVAADRSSSILRCSRPVRERTNLNLQSAARRRGDHSFRASHVPPLRGSPRSVLPELQPAFAATTNQVRLRIADLRMRDGAGAAHELDHDCSSGQSTHGPATYILGSEASLTSVAE